MSEVSKLFSFIRSCIEGEVRSLDRYVPWYGYLASVLTTALAFHRATVVGSVARATPEVARNLVIPYLAQQQMFVKPFTPLSNKCLSSIKELLSFANAVAARFIASPFYRVYPRIGVGIVRLSAFLARSLAEDGVYIDYRTLMAVLNELEVYLSTAVTLLHARGGVE